MKRNIAKKLRKCKRKIKSRVRRRNWEDQVNPMSAGGNIYYDIDSRHKATAHGGIGNIHQLAVRSGLVEVVINREYKRIVPKAEDIAEIQYRPGKCQKMYRLIILRKTMDVLQGTMNLFEDIRYFFYISNDWGFSPNELIHFYRQRSHHENDIDQLKNGVKAFSPSSDTLLSNWALMAIASLAGDLKGWFGLLLPYRPLGLSVVRMEFKRFLNTFIRIPCLIIRTGRRLCYRVVGYNDKLQHVIKFNHMIKSFSGP